MIDKQEAKPIPADSGAREAFLAALADLINAQYLQGKYINEGGDYTSDYQEAKKDGYKAYKNLVALYDARPSAPNDEAREALAELVACKDLKERKDEAQSWDHGHGNISNQGVCTCLANTVYHELVKEYMRRQPLAWANARRVLGQGEKG